MTTVYIIIGLLIVISVLILTCFQTVPIILQSLNKIHEACENILSQSNITQNYSNLDSEVYNISSDVNDLKKATEKILEFIQEKERKRIENQGGFEEENPQF